MSFQALDNLPPLGGAFSPLAAADVSDDSSDRALLKDTTDAIVQELCRKALMQKDAASLVAIGDIYAKGAGALPPPL